MTIEERLEALTQTMELHASLQIDEEKRREKRMEDFAKRMEIDEKRMQRTDRRLDRAVRLAVQDARRQRKWNAEAKEEMKELRSLQAQVLKAFLQRNGNGQH